MGIFLLLAKIVEYVPAFILPKCFVSWYLRYISARADLEKLKEIAPSLDPSHIDVSIYLPWYHTAIWTYSWKSPDLGSSVLCGYGWRARGLSILVWFASGRYK